MNLMKVLKTKKKDIALGVTTVTLIALFTLVEWRDDEIGVMARLAFSPGYLVVVLPCFLTFAFGLILSNLEKRAGILFMSVALLPLMLLFTNGFILVLAIIFVAELAVLITLPVAFVCALVIPLVYFPLSINEFVWTNTLLFMTYNIFAVFISHRLKKEREGRLRVSHLLRELHATQDLLSCTSKRDERLRIARDIHDVLGHHLTALSLQLEIAEQLSSAPSTQHINRAKSISKLLLSDIRETVSDLRNQTSLEIHSALQALTHGHETIDVKLQMADEMTVHDARVAEALFRTVQEALTNVVKHSEAEQCTVQLTRQSDTINLKISDNGGVNAPIKMGHGLNGMKERVTGLDGEMKIHQSADGVEVVITMPDPQEYL